jgi:hypothetical protein
MESLPEINKRIKVILNSSKDDGRNASLKVLFEATNNWCARLGIRNFELTVGVGAKGKKSTFTVDDESTVIETLLQVKGRDTISFTRLQSTMLQWFRSFEFVRAQLVRMTEIKFPKLEGEEERAYLSRVCKLTPKLACWWRFWDHDLRICIEPFRTLGKIGDIKMMLDSLILIAVHLSY